MAASEVTTSTNADNVTVKFYQVQKNGLNVIQKNLEERQEITNSAIKD